MNSKLNSCRSLNCGAAPIFCHRVASGRMQRKSTCLPMQRYVGWGCLRAARRKISIRDFPGFEILGSRISGGRDFQMEISVRSGAAGDRERREGGVSPSTKLPRRLWSGPPGTCDQHGPRPTSREGGRIGDGGRRTGLRVGDAINRAAMTLGPPFPARRGPAAVVRSAAPYLPSGSPRSHIIGAIALRLSPPLHRYGVIWSRVSVMPVDSRDLKLANPCARPNLTDRVFRLINRNEKVRFDPETSGSVAAQSEAVCLPFDTENLSVWANISDDWDVLRVDHVGSVLLEPGTERPTRSLVADHLVFPVSGWLTHTKTNACPRAI